MRTSLRVLVAALGVLLAGAVATGSTIFVMNESEEVAAAPALYTNANSADVWASPIDHLGARVAVTGEVAAAQAIDDGALLAVRVEDRLAAVHVFDEGFRAQTGERIRVVGTVRGPLGDGALVPGVAASAALPAGTAVIDAAAVSALKRSGPS